MSYRGQPRRDREQRRPSKKRYEEDAIVLEVISPDRNTRRGRYGDSAILQVVGTSWFTLLEIIPEDHNTLMLGDRIKLGKDERSQVETIIGRIAHEDLTPVGELQLETAIDEILEQNSSRYVQWLNHSTPISLRLHSLHLIKGIGPKSLKKILEERKIKEFETYEEFEERTGVGNIRGLIKQRIIDELTDPMEKHQLFTRVFHKENKERR
ncbi:MAG: DUF655 domain-containing protein [Candidatus Kariarchaeaceae archaeon]|jgi:putative nucleotide binding protein